MIPNDPYMLLSWLNLKLRDEYDSFEELCRSEDADAEKIHEKMAAIGAAYDEAEKRFR